uniref:Uncharacterized protein n=1 Tax=candidate division WOR-3 bacterium TaxID=2052148 RepID=A0A7C2K598_UNCW3
MGLMVDWGSLIIQKIIEWSIPFSLGLLFRKKVGRFLIVTKKRLFNDILTITLFSIRHYGPYLINEIDYKIYEDLRTKIPTVKPRKNKKNDEKRERDSHRKSPRKREN